MKIFCAEFAFEQEAEGRKFVVELVGGPSSRGDASAEIMLRGLNGQAAGGVENRISVGILLHAGADQLEGGLSDSG